MKITTHDISFRGTAFDMEAMGLYVLEKRFVPHRDHDAGTKFVRQWEIHSNLSHQSPQTENAWAQARCR
jgi:hypothetical protein